MVLKEDCESLGRAAGFYGHLDTSMRHSSWDLLKALHTQAKILWVVFRDFNETVHPNEKLGWRDRDANQMKVFRETISGCELIDLGFVGQRYTW